MYTEPNTEFTCPKCGSHCWGTSELRPDGTGGVGHCHGTSHCYGTEDPVVDCDFDWPRSEDNKYFGPIEKSSIINSIPIEISKTG